MDGALSTTNVSENLIKPTRCNARPPTMDIVLFLISHGKLMMLYSHHYNRPFYNDVKRGFQDDTRNLIGSAIVGVLFKPIKFRLT